MPFFLTRICYADYRSNQTDSCAAKQLNAVAQCNQHQSCQLKSKSGGHLRCVCSGISLERFDAKEYRKRWSNLIQLPAL